VLHFVEKFLPRLHLKPCEKENIQGWKGIHKLKRT
jgi:hypothetical protein